MVPLVANLDPKPLKINGLQLYNPYQAPIELVSTIKDTTLLPGDTLFVAFAFTPAKPKEYQVTVFVYYADQGKFKKTVRVRGQGILPAARFAVPVLPFIPEIASQTVPIVNSSEEKIRFTEAMIDPPVYTCSGAKLLIPAPLMECWFFAILILIVESIVCRSPLQQCIRSRPVIGSQWSLKPLSARRSSVSCVISLDSFCVNGRLLSILQSRSSMFPSTSFQPVLTGCVSFLLAGQK